MNAKVGYRLCFAHIWLMVTALTTWGWTPHGFAQTPSPLDAAVERFKEQYNFSAWGGKVKTQGRIQGIDSLAEDLELLFDLEVLSATAEQDRSLTARIKDTEKSSGGDVTIGVLSTALEAQEAPFRGFVYHSAPPGYVKAHRGTNFDVGDACLFTLKDSPPAGIPDIAGRPFIGRMYFSRNNVGVQILNNCEPGKEYLDVLFLAKVIDRLLCNHIIQDATKPENVGD